MQRCSRAPLFQNIEKEGKIMDYLYSTYRAFNCRINLINKIYTVDAKTLNTSHLKLTPLTLAPAFLIKTPFQKSSIPPTQIVANFTGSFPRFTLCWCRAIMQMQMQNTYYGINDLCVPSSMSCHFEQERKKSLLWQPISLGYIQFLKSNISF